MAISSGMSSVTVRCSGRRPSANRPQLHLLAASLAVTLLALLPVARAQMVGSFMRPSSPDWSSTRTVVMLVIEALVLPCFVVSGVLMYRRRKTWPIASRSPTLLLLFTASAAVGSLISAALHIAYPDGMPCAMLVVFTFLPFPYAVMMIVRGHLLIFRLEIQNYLAELAWRKEKTRRLLQRQADENDSGLSRSRAATMERAALTTPSAAESTGGEGSGSAAASSGCPRAESDPLSLPSLDPSTLPGHFCISNRRFMSAKTIAMGLVGNVAGMVLSMALTAIYDWDVEFTDDWRESHGLPRDSPSNQYADGAFFEGPRCFIYSIKFVTFYAAMFFTFPFVSGVSWRLRVNARLMEQRAREQAEFDAVMRATSTGGGDKANGADVPSPLAAAGGGVSSASSSSHAPTASELDELAAVKIEMAAGVLFGGSSLVLYISMISYAYAWLNIVMGLTLAGFWACSIMPALVASYSVARKQRQVLLRARRDTKSGAKGGKLVALVPHHRPLYRLAHVIADPHTYPVLLKFLQKEYSSENALFYIEARRFARECRAAERALPGWSSSLDDDDASDTHTTEGSPMHSRVSRGAGHLVSAGSVVSGEGAGAVHAPVDPQGQGGSAPNAQSYVVMEPMREANQSKTGVGSVGKDSRLFAIRVEQPGGGGGGGVGSPAVLDNSPTVAYSPSAPPSASATPVQQARSIPNSPSLMGSRWSPAAGAATPAATATAAAAANLPNWALSPSPSPTSPADSRAVSMRGIGVGVGIELSPSTLTTASPLSPETSLNGPHTRVLISPPSGTRVLPGSGSGGAPGSPAPSSPLQQQRSPQRSSGSFSVRTLAATQVRTELAWGVASGPGHPSTSQPASPASPRRPPFNHAATSRPSPSKVAPLQRQTTKKLLAPQATTNNKNGHSSSSSSSAPEPPPLSFRQMHELACGLRARCLRLYDDYLRPNSVFQINIANDLAKMVRSQIAQLELWQPTPLTAEGEPDYERAAMESTAPVPPPFPLSSLYQQTALSIFNLMETDSFRRFLLTSDFELLLQRADDAEMERLGRQSGLTDDSAALIAQADAVLHAAAAAATDSILPGATLHDSETARAT